MSKAEKFEGTCGICERRFRTSGNCVVLHGYQRPGDGYIVGRCYGEKMPAWEISSEPAKLFLAEVLVPRYAGLVERLADFNNGRVTGLRIPVEQSFRDRRNNVPVQYETLTPSSEKWAREFKIARARVASELDHFDGMIKRFQKRIAAWAPAKLTPVAAEEKQMRVVFVKELGEWVATSLKSDRTIARGCRLDYVMAASVEKGYKLPQGVTEPVEIKPIELFREAALIPEPHNRHRLVSDSRLDPITSKMIVAAYEQLAEDQKSLFNRIYFREIQRCGSGYYTDELTVGHFLARVTPLLRAKDASETGK